MTSMSNRTNSRWNFSEKLITEEKSARSTLRSSHDLNPVLDSISGRDAYEEKAFDIEQGRTRNGSFTLAFATTSEDKFGRIHTREMFGSIETDIRVGADDHDGFSGQIRTLDGRYCGPLVGEKVERCFLHGSSKCGEFWCSLGRTEMSSSPRSRFVRN